MLAVIRDTLCAKQTCKPGIVGLPSQAAAQVKQKVAGLGVGRAHAQAPAGQQRRERGVQLRAHAVPAIGDLHLRAAALALARVCAPCACLGMFALMRE